MSRVRTLLRSVRFRITAIAAVVRRTLPSPDAPA